MEKMYEKLREKLRDAENAKEGCIHVFYPSYHDEKKIKSSLLNVLEDHFSFTFIHENDDDAVDAMDALTRGEIKMHLKEHDEPFVLFQGKVGGKAVAGYLHLLTERSEMRGGDYSSESIYEAMVRDEKGALLLGRHKMSRMAPRRVLDEMALRLTYNDNDGLHVTKITKSRGLKEEEEPQGVEKLREVLERAKKTLGVKAVEVAVMSSQTKFRRGRALHSLYKKFAVRVERPQDIHARFNTLLMEVAERMLKGESIDEPLQQLKELVEAEQD